MRGQKASARLAALVALALLLASCDVAFQGSHASATDEWKRTYTLAAGGRVQIINVNGAIDVAPSADAATVEVVAVRRVRAATEEDARQRLKSIEIKEQASPSEIRLEVSRASQGMHLGGTSADVRFQVKVPRNASVTLSTRTGAVHVFGLAGVLKIETANGEITGEDIAGTVDAGTTNGPITMKMAAVGPDGIRLDTTNGPIELKVPTDTKATVSARWSHGGFEASGLKAEGQTERRRYEGKLNGGGPRIELSTTNGPIRISS